MHCCIEHIHSDKTRCMAMAITEPVEITKDNPFLREKGGTTVTRRSILSSIKQILIFVITEINPGTERPIAYVL